jgi:hypothetical protein
MFPVTKRAENGQVGRTALRWDALAVESDQWLAPAITVTILQFSHIAAHFLHVLAVFGARSLK